jgi:hypothetical protein
VAAETNESTGALAGGQKTGSGKTGTEGKSKFEHSPWRLAHEQKRPAREYEINQGKTASTRCKPRFFTVKLKHN